MDAVVGSMHVLAYMHLLLDDGKIVFDRAGAVNGDADGVAASALRLRGGAAGVGEGEHHGGGHEGAAEG